MAINKDHYFIGHAHLDPAWSWRWQEGSCVIKATVQSALDRMREYPDFTFMLPTTLHIGWIEEFCPEMFEEVKQRIAEGRILLLGGTVITMAMDRRLPVVFRKDSTASAETGS